ncbi:hypothetical protein [Aureispira sp. CCB-E]|uniref:hypothetical protein n=1 Tax=Aureispira sp. CCB-E TaxID=3051121 RepID=UPI00286859A5|nr:hypothetical protein [Aureispira sp. CCB-E]WMX13201.1 hypothetical protein QP953_20365 [Aureispira sp. CCB-E]WMX17161.1 hypothetical protein QP953_12325 [Aureispira sp. CCB-E]
MTTKNACVILDQLLQKLQQKLEKEQQKLTQMKGSKNPLQLLCQEQQICLLKTKIKSTQTYLQQLRPKASSAKI